MEEQGFLLKDVDYDDETIPVIRDVQSPYETGYIQNPYEGNWPLYNLQFSKFIEEMKY